MYYQREKQHPNASVIPNEASAVLIRKVSGRGRANVLDTSARPSLCQDGDGYSVFAFTDDGTQLCLADQVFHSEAHRIYREALSIDMIHNGYSFLSHQNTHLRDPEDFPRICVKEI